MKTPDLNEATRCARLSAQRTGQPHAVRRLPDNIYEVLPVLHVSHPQGDINAELLRWHNLAVAAELRGEHELAAQYRKEVERWRR